MECRVVHITLLLGCAVEAFGRGVGTAFAGSGGAFWAAVEISWVGFGAESAHWACGVGADGVVVAEAEATAALVGWSGRVILGDLARLISDDYLRAFEPSGVIGRG